MATIVVPYDGREAGNGSKDSVIKYDNVNPIIMSVASNLPGNIDRSAVIENLVIDGRDAAGKPVAGTIGILLENVYNCLIRNITIRDCDVGIKVKVTGNNWAHANRFEHIRMIRVKTGIQFVGEETAKDFAYTTIDNVCMSLKPDTPAVGIKIGDSPANNASLYCAFIKATVWMDRPDHKGLEVNGELKYSLVNLEVEQPYNSTGSYGYSAFISSGAVVNNNQSFLLAALFPDGGNHLVNQNGPNTDDITVFPQ